VVAHGELLDGQEYRMKAEGASPAIVTDHVFEPRLESDPHYRRATQIDERKVKRPNPYLCQRCRLAEAAHAK
jgi:hypothetical protein